jgi:protein phosphatase
LRKAFVEANASIHARGQQNREFEGMGTTSTALLVRPEGAWIGHVGDSRAYRIRNGRIEQLSFDHSLVWEYARRQNLNPDQVQGIPSNVIIRSLGPEPLVQVDIEGPYPVHSGDMFVLCSDGLSGQVTDHELGAVASTLPPDEACRFLVDLANLRGGPDNITVVIVRLGGAGARPRSKGSRWLRVIPWPLYVLFLGAALAALPVYLTINGMPGVVPAIVIAFAVIMTGLVGLSLHLRRERRRAAEEAEHPPPQIHRQTPCAIERSLLEKLRKAEQALKDHIAERQWDADWATHEKYRALAEQHLVKNDLPAAFREACRAMQVLLGVFQRQRNREEMFQPLWDKG